MKHLHNILLSFLPFSLVAQVTQVTFQPAGTANNDAFVVVNNSTNYGTNGFLSTYVNGTSSSPIVRRSFIEFDVTSIPSNAIIVDAKLHLRRTNHNSNANVEIARILPTWSESTITGNNMPSVTSVSMSNQSVSLNNGWHVFTVTDFVQLFVNYPHLNKGLRLRSQTETVTGFSCLDRNGNWVTCFTTEGTDYASADHGTSDWRPKLVIDYVLPIDIGLTSVSHATDITSSNGSITANVIGGNGSYTYQWINGATGNVISGATGLTINDLTPGWYGLEVEDGLGNMGYMAFIVGADCGVLNLEFNPGTNYVKDTYLFDRVFGGIDYGDYNYSHTTIWGTEKWTHSVWYNLKSLLKFNLIIPNDLNLNRADFVLIGLDHNQLSRPNNSDLFRVTDSWVESVVTNNTAPGFTTQDAIYLPPTTTTTQNDTIDILNFWSVWMNDPEDNFGVFMQLQDHATNSHTRRRYYSSEHGTSSNWPKMLINVGDYCFEPTPMVQRRPDGDFYLATNDKLYFSLIERYEQPSNEPLNYSIYGSDRQTISVGQALNVSFDDNRYIIDLSSLGLTLGDTYILEVTFIRNFFKIRHKISVPFYLRGMKFMS